jgi:hypothetical protein
MVRPAPDLSPAIEWLKSVAGDALAPAADGFEEAVLDARGAVRRWRRTFAGGWDYRPEPWFSQRRGLTPDPDAPAPAGGSETWVGTDDDNAVRLVERRPPGAETGTALEVWDGVPGVLRCWTRDGARFFRVRDGVVDAVIGWDDGMRVAELWTVEGGVATEGRIARLRGDFIDTEVYSATLGTDGLRSLSWASRTTTNAVVAPAEALLAAIAAATSLTPAEQVYSAPPAVTSVTRALDSPDTIAAELVRALIEAVDRSQVEEPSVLLVQLDRDGTPRSWVGSAEIFSDRHARPGEVDSLLPRLHQAMPPYASPLDISTLLSSQTLERLRYLGGAATRARTDEDATRQLDEAIISLREHLLAGLNNPARWGPKVDSQFVALTTIAPPADFVDPIALAADYCNPKHLQRLRPLVGRPSSALTGSFSNVAEFRQALLEARLPETLIRAAARAATTALALTPSPDRASVGTRVAGQVPLQPETPLASDGAPLRLAAAVLLSELPATSLLPREGWLLFYVDTRDSAAQALYEGVRNAAGAPARVLFANGVTWPLSEDQIGSVLYVRAQAMLVPPIELAHGGEIKEADAQRYKTLVNEYRGLDAYGDRMLSPLAPDEPADGGIRLLRLSSHPELDLDFVLSGDLQFDIPLKALAARDWDRCTIRAATP